MKRHVISLLGILTAISPAATVPFESAADLSAYNVTNFTGTLSQAAGIGAGSPSTGGLRYVGPNNNVERGAIIRRTDSVTQDHGIWTTSILLNPKEFDNGSSDKTEIRLGFASTDNTSTSKPWEYFNKLNTSISVKLKAEGANLVGGFEGELTNFVTAEAKIETLTANSSPYFNDWVRLSLKLVRSGGTGFTAFYQLESLGADGTSAPTVIFTSTTHTLANPALATSATVYTGFSIKAEKSRINPVYLDDHLTTFEAVAPDAPVNAAPASVAAQSVTAEWQAPSGIIPSSYVLEITTAADNFAPGTFISATGATGQAAGISVAGPATSQVVTGLLPQTGYVYRVRSVNSVGGSDPSNVASFQTLSLTQNSPPTLDEIANVGAFPTRLPSVNVPLAGISSGGESAQTVTVTAVSSNPAVASPAVSYVSPATTGHLLLTLGGVEGSATITVTANDGQPQNHSVIRSFTVTVRNPPVVIDYENASDLDEFEVAANATLTHTWYAGAGIGNPAGNGLILSSGSVTSGERGFAAWRKQGHLLNGATLLKTSILVNMAQLDDISSGESKLELRLGYASSLTPNPTKPADFLKTNDSINVVLKGEHSPGDSGKLRKLEAEIANVVGGVETKAAKVGVLNSAHINDWLRFTVSVLPTGGDGFEASYVVESLGANGTDSPTVVLTAGPFAFTNASLGAANTLHAAYSGKMDKQLTYVRLDQHTSLAQSDIPSQPIALAANNVTSTSFRANWRPDGEYAPQAWLLEVVPQGSTFAAGNFISADGTPGQATGIVVAGALSRFQTVSNLAPDTAYRYRVIGTNINGGSIPSAEIGLTTLAPGVNSPPTLDAIANPAAIAIDSATQTIGLTGIGSGGEDGQALTVTAVSSNPGLVPNPTVTYTSPAATASLAYSPAPGAVGNAIITVTVSDGAANNSTFSRTFTIRVVNPDPIIDFDSPDDLAELTVAPFNGTLGHAPTGGTQGSGGVAFQGTVPGSDRVGVVVRPTAFDANSASYLVASIDFNAAEIFNITTGKDKAEVRLGFMGNSSVNVNKPQDTVNKTHPSVGMKFKLEEEVGKADKHRNLEAELFWWNGVSENKDAKLTLDNVAAADHWFRVTFQAVRSGGSQYSLSYVVDDMGPDGSGFVARVMQSTAISVSNAPFFTDSSVFSAFSISDEKAGPGNVLRADRFETVVNTTAPDSPAISDVFDIKPYGFTIGWSPSLLGNPAQGYIVEVVNANAPFLPGNFYPQAGEPNQNTTGGQATGFRVENPYTLDAAITGLSRLTSYRVRVRAYGESPAEEQSLALNSLLATTLFGPGVEYDEWRVGKFGPDAANEAIAGRNADPDGDGISNLLEYAFGLDPRASDAHRLPKADVSGDYLTITYRRRHQVDSVTYEPQAAGDLGDWHGDDDFDGPLEYVTGPDADGMETVTVEDFYEIGTFPKRFLRVKVEGE